jgi:NAD(P)-dependent dehydrogenase (short-subunit alcohol dehydrogenase family)
MIRISPIGRIGARERVGSGNRTYLQIISLICRINTYLICLISASSGRLGWRSLHPVRSRPDRRSVGEMAGAARTGQAREGAMAPPRYDTALIVGAGHGLSASLARLFAREGIRVAVAARDVGKLAGLSAETGAEAFACDAADPDQVAGLFDAVEARIGVPDIVVYNASGRARGPVVDLVPAEVERTLAVSAFGGFLVAQQAARRLLPKGSGAILFTGASASVKGYARSAPFAMGKFALRGLAQSLARELAPRGIHVVHFVIDGGIRSPVRVESPDKPDSLLDPDAIAQTYLDITKQARSAWTWEVELRPWVETF